MKVLRHTLVSEGTTDAHLIPIIDWSLKQVGGVSLPEGTRAEFGRLLKKPAGLAERLATAIELYPCEVLFVHRDADKTNPANRIAEIREAVAFLETQGKRVPAVAIIPVRMLEAWLCFDERAIRCAAGNPNGNTPLELPLLKQIESRPDPKSDLTQAIRAASELSGRRLKKFDTRTAFWRIVDFIDDFSPLRELSAFRSFEASLVKLKEDGWKPGLYASPDPASGNSFASTPRRTSRSKS